MPRKSSRRMFDLPHFNSTSPSTPPAFIRTNSTSTLVDDNRPEDRFRCNHRAEYILDWALKLVCATCAVLFGIWAPLSYQLQKDGNKSNDVAQEDLRREVSALNAQLKLLCALTAIKICDTHTERINLEVCKNFRAGLGFEDVIAKFAPRPAASIAPSARPGQGSDAAVRAESTAASGVEVTVTKILTVAKETSVPSFRGYEYAGSVRMMNSLSRPLATKSGLRSSLIGYMDGQFGPWVGSYHGYGGYVDTGEAGFGGNLVVLALGMMVGMVWMVGWSGGKVGRRETVK